MTAREWQLQQADFGEGWTAARAEAYAAHVNKELVEALMDAANEVLTCVSLNRNERKRMFGRIDAALAKNGGGQ